VVAVADGDTLTILDAGRQQRRIRLAEIDAPEKRQPFGQRSKQSLSIFATAGMPSSRTAGATATAAPSAA
jgi:endonuclease YncB( thermonuclease family)